MSMVRYKQSELPPLTEERKVELKTLAEMPDTEIDYSDIPPWKRDAEYCHFKTEERS
jgi:hypothetical protein